jgi:glucosamine-6-phosphate deaminase
MTSFKNGGLEIQILKSRSELGEAAASSVASYIRKILDGQQQVNMVFAAAPSQLEFLFQLSRKRDLDWTRINAFHMDEYVGLDVSDARSFAFFLQSHFFKSLPLGSVHFIHGKTKDPLQSCLDYIELIKKYPTDIVCMGIGENGHIAFNEPNQSNFRDEQLVKLVNLDQASRAQQVNDGCFNVLDEVPTQAITMTIPTLLSSRYIFCMVPGERKSTAVFNALYGPVSEACPASVLRTHPQARLFLDDKSSSLVTSENHWQN